MNRQYGLYFLEARWGDVVLYQKFLRRVVYDENRREALVELARSIVRFDRAERAQ